MRKKRITSEKNDPRVLMCPVCLSDRLDMISSRMKKCKSCGFIWNHEVSDRDNLLLIMEHKAKREMPERPDTDRELGRSASRKAQAR